MKHTVSLFVVIGLLLSILGASPVLAATHCVNPGGTGGCFSSIQTAINIADPGDTITVAAGTYVEDVVIDRSLSLVGPNFLIDPNTGSRVAEAIVVPATSAPDPAVCQQIVYINGADDVTIMGFTFDGNNPGNTSGDLVGGVDVEGCEGIASYEGVGGILIENNIIQNLTYTGIDFYNYYNGGAATSGNTIRNNQFNNIGDVTYGYGIGTLIYNNFYADITNNVYNNVRTGIQTGNFYQANPGATGQISDNEINTWRLGIFHNLWYGNADGMPVSDNTIIAQSDARSALVWGMLISSWQGDVGTMFTGNDITIGAVSQSDTAGYTVWNTPTTGDIEIVSGTVTGGVYGVFVNNFEGYPPGSGSNADDTSARIQSVSLIEQDYGIYVKDSDSNTNGATVYAAVSDVQVTGATYNGIRINGEDASADVSGSLFGEGDIGAVIGDHATALFYCNSIYNNDTAGMQNISDGAVTAEDNWWGDSSGPYNTGSNILGIGDAVSDGVDFHPFNTSVGCAPSELTAPTVITSEPADGATLSSELTSITVTFNKDVKEDLGSEAANSTSNYLLVEAGLNESVDTPYCLGGVAADDIAQTINSVAYDDGSQQATLSVNLAANGEYRLFVCGTTSIEDTLGIELNSGEFDSTVDFTIDIPGAEDAFFALPETGFAQGTVTTLPAQPASAAYAQTSMTLSIPSLGLNTEIVGVPQDAAGGWDLTWLGSHAGFLDGSAFPTWTGNTVITAHAWDSNNHPGPFYALNTLQAGDTFSIKAFGLTYTYQVTDSELLNANANWRLHHDDYDMVTLVTCEGYANGDYLYRRVVTAILISVE